MSDSDNNNGASRQPVTFPVENWIVCCEWRELVQEPAIATAEYPQAKGRQFVQIRRINEVINVHPIIHASHMLQSGLRTDYIILWAMPISAYYYDLVMQPQQTQAEVVDITDRISKKEKLH